MGYLRKQENRILRLRKRLIHARMGRPRRNWARHHVTSSYPCTHGATNTFYVLKECSRFLSMHAWGDLFADAKLRTNILPIHARMGRPLYVQVGEAIGYSYPCTHGATVPSHLIHEAFIFLSMHAWGDLWLASNESHSLIPIHARMGRPSGRNDSGSGWSSYPCTHGATSYYNYLINKDNLTILTFADFCYTFFGMKRY